MYRCPVCDLGISGEPCLGELSSRMGIRLVCLGLERLRNLPLTGIGSLEFDRDFLWEWNSRS